jgi:hypothetical protein
MKNVLMKKHIMNSTSAVEKTIIGLDECLLSYDYYFSTSITGYTGQYNKIYINKICKPFELIPFDYDRVKFNMITCPAGGKVNIENWGEQEIKEPFMLGETEVTQELFEAIMGFNYSKFKDSNKNPVENVTWYDCLEFCNRLSDYFDLDHCYLVRDKKFTDSEYPLSIEKASVTFIADANGFRLPKEWEWQIAAMAGTNNQYAGANDDESVKRVAWFGENSGKKTHPVAQKIPNEWGFYDMSGNLWELCENAYDFYSNDALSARRVHRGGGWGYGDASGLRSAGRDDGSPSFRYGGVGFRVARSI